MGKGWLFKDDWELHAVWERLAFQMEGTVTTGRKEQGVDLKDAADTCKGESGKGNRKHGPHAIGNEAIQNVWEKGSDAILLWTSLR